MAAFVARRYAMSRPAKITRPIVRRVVAAAAILPMLVALLPQLALCAGPGGHLAIEPANAKCCQHGLAALEQTSAEQCADHCTDTPLSSGPVITAGAAQRHRAPLRLIPAPAIHPAIAVLPAQLSSVLLRLPDRPPRARLTTVILC